MGFMESPLNPLKFAARPIRRFAARAKGFGGFRTPLGRFRCRPRGRGVAPRVFPASSTEKAGDPFCSALRPGFDARDGEWRGWIRVETFWGSMFFNKRWMIRQSPCVHMCSLNMHEHAPFVLLTA